jgi:hypothetical protein
MNTAIDILTAIGGLIGAVGGLVALLSWINTRKAEHKKADAEASGIVQEVYEKVIKSLDARITRLEQRECLRDDCKLRIQ